MAPADCQNHDTQVMNNNKLNGLYQITILPCKTKLHVLPLSKPLLVASIAHLFILHRLSGRGAQSEFI